MIEKQNNHHWFSFSYKGKNQGVCVVEANNHKEALQKTIDNNIQPPHDDIASYQGYWPEMKLDYLYSKAEMMKNKEGVRFNSLIK